MKILVTGFDPFGQEKVNPASEAVMQLPKEIAGATIIRAIIPTIRYRSLAVIEELILQYDPDVIISIGQAGGSHAIAVERVGINCDDYRICDNAGNQPQDCPIVAAGPDAYFVNIPTRQIVKSIQAAGIPARLSYSAGTFVCNHVLYGTRHLLATRYPAKRSGFIHVPYLLSQAAQLQAPGMSLETIVRALETALEVIAKSEAADFV